MTAEEQIEYLATKVMGWDTRIEKDCYGDEYMMVNWKDPYYAGGVPKGWVTQSGFDPTSDWNHWRQVEIKALEDKALWNKYMLSFFPAFSSGAVSLGIFVAVSSDLPQRVSALIQAHKELYPILK